MTLRPHAERSPLGADITELDGLRDGDDFARFVTRRRWHAASRPHAASGSVKAPA